MAIHQTMSGMKAQKTIDDFVQIYARMIRSEELALADAHKLLMSGNLSLFATAGLAKAIACFECEE